VKKISSRFSVATHILTLVATHPGLTGDIIASSVNTNPAIIRKITGQLKKAGLVQVRAGAGGASLGRQPDQITLLDVYHAVEVVKPNEIFNFHEHPNPNCLVGANIEKALRATMIRAQTALENELAQVTLSQLTSQLLDEAELR